MSVMNQPMRYGSVSQVLHWTIAALVFVQLAMGKAGLVEAEHPKTAAFMWHGSLGIIILVLALARIVWILISRPPGFPQTMSRIGRISARTLHVSLYVLLVALPLSGWLAASSAGSSVNFFDVATVPAWRDSTVRQAQPQMRATPQANGEEAEDGAEEVHELLGDALLILVTVHILAALKHQFVDRDRLIQRMLPARRARLTPQDVPPGGG